MKLGTWAELLLAAAPLLAGCGNFWQAPSGSTSFTLANSGTISVSPGSTNSATITVTPSNSFTGTVALTCAVTSSPSNATSPATCSLSPTSVTISDTSAQTSTLTASTTSATTTGGYEMTVTGVSGSASESTSICVLVGSSSSSCSSSSTSGVFYVLNKTTDQIVAMSISSGQLTTISTLALPTAAPLALSVAPNGKFLYVSTAGGIYLYTIGSNGTLTLQNNTPISQDTPNTMQVDATNSWLVESVSGMYQLNAIAINSSTGALAAIGETEQIIALPGSTVTQLAISPNDSSSCGNCYVFVGMSSDGTAVVRFNPGNANPFGSIGNIRAVNSSGGANTVAVDPKNRLLYVGETTALPSATQTGGLRAFTIGATAITELSGSPYASTGAGPIAIQPTSDGSYVYVANRSVSGSTTGNIAGFSVSTTSLTSIGSSVAAGPTGQIGLAEDSTGSFLLAVDSAGNPDLQAYSMSSGTLTSALTGTTGNDPVGAIAIAAAP